MAKKTTKKIECINCKNFDGVNCHKNGNIGIIVKYRNEQKCYISTPEELNKNKDCKFYAKLSKK